MKLDAPPATAIRFSQQGPPGTGKTMTGAGRVRERVRPAIFARAGVPDASRNPSCPMSGYSGTRPPSSWTQSTSVTGKSFSIIRGRGWRMNLASSTAPIYYRYLLTRIWRRLRMTSPFFVYPCSQASWQSLRERGRLIHRAELTVVGALSTALANGCADGHGRRVDRRAACGDDSLEKRKGGSEDRASILEVSLVCSRNDQWTSPMLA